MIVRSARAADASALHAIAIANPTAPQWTAAQFHETLQPHPGLAVQREVVVAEQGGQVLGFAVVAALVSVYPVDAELESIAVHADSQRKGIGRTLLRAVFEWCRNRGAGSLRLEVRTSNEAARSLYQDSGFQYEGTRSRYYTSPTEDAMCMRKDFAAEMVLPRE